MCEIMCGEENPHTPQRWVRQSVAWSDICVRALAKAQVVGGFGLERPIPHPPSEPPHNKYALQ